MHIIQKVYPVLCVVVLSVYACLCVFVACVDFRLFVSYYKHTHTHTQRREGGGVMIEVHVQYTESLDIQCV